jgi:hypothetical protein
MKKNDCLGISSSIDKYSLSGNQKQEKSGENQVLTVKTSPKEQINRQRRIQKEMESIDRDISQTEDLNQIARRLDESAKTSACQFKCTMIVAWATLLVALLTLVSTILAAIFFDVINDFHKLDPNIRCKGKYCHNPNARKCYQNSEFVFC